MKWINIDLKIKYLLVGLFQPFSLAGQGPFTAMAETVKSKLNEHEFVLIQIKLNVFALFDI